MKQIHLKTPKLLALWKALEKLAKDAPERAAAVAAFSTEAGLAKDEAATVVVRAAQAVKSSARLKTVDEAMAFMKDAPEDIREITREALGTMERTSIPMVISDDTEDRDRDIVEPTGIDTKEYRKNNVMLWGHDHKIPAVGNGNGVHNVAKEVRAIATFNPADIDPFGAMLGRMYDAKILRAVSIGFIPKTFVFEPERSPYAMRYTDSELIEFSPCNVGSNRNALAQARSFGIEITPALQQIERALDEAKAGDRPDAEALFRLLAPTKAFSIPALKSAAATAAKSPAELRAEARGEKSEQDETGEMVDWLQVAALLGKEVGPESFATAVRASTYGKSATEQAQRSKDAAAAQEAVEKLIAEAKDDDCDHDETDDEDPVEPVAANADVDTNAPAREDDARDEGTEQPKAATSDLAKGLLAIAERKLTPTA